MGYICLNLIDLSKKKVHFVYSKLNLRPKNCLLEIGASNLEGPFIYGDHSSNQFLVSVTRSVLSCLLNFSFDHGVGIYVMVFVTKHYGT